MATQKGKNQTEGHVHHILMPHLLGGSINNKKRYRSTIRVAESESNMESEPFVTVWANRIGVTLFMRIKCRERSGRIKPGR